MIDLHARLSADLVLSECLVTSHREFLDRQMNPPLSVVANLERHARTLWQPVRDILGVPLRVTSGYRCWPLNTAVGGDMHSVHPQGLATDNLPVGLSLFDAMARIVKHLADLEVDQVIYECNTWIHLGSPEPGAPPRRLALMKFPGDRHYPTWDPTDPRVHR